ncbi:MAG: mercury(II) reductase [Rhodospirillaceae bacterium]|nr:MAG: mercury(II) reductase [Rhodospirillaceae bacterium]
MTHRPHTSPKGGYDLAVIGAGAAGFSAAITAAEQGAQVALIGHGTIGGTCVNVGCVPSKTLIRAAEAVHQAHTASRFEGLRAEGRLVDWRALVRQKDALVASLRQEKYKDLLPRYETLNYLEGPARLADNGVVVNGDLIQAAKLVIATGARPALPAIAGIEDVPALTSTTAMELEFLPKSLLVIGGGYIGCEQAQMFARLGVEVTLTCRSRLLPSAEPEISEALTHCLVEEGIAVRCGLTYRSLARTGDGIAFTVLEDEKTQTITTERLLVATGRTPNTGGLGLKEAGIALNRDGTIRVDNHMQTSQPNIYAAGDVTGLNLFVYMAAYGAGIAAKNALGDTRSYNNHAMPWVVFTDPQVAGVGWTEAEARARGHETRISVLPLDRVPRALAARDTRGLIKLVADAPTNRLLGAHILAPEGADSIQTAALAIRHNLTIADLTDMIFPYLTTVEGLKLAALAFDRDVTKLSCCAV